MSIFKINVKYRTDEIRSENNKGIVHVWNVFKYRLNTPTNRKIEIHIRRFLKLILETPDLFMMVFNPRSFDDFRNIHEKLEIVEDRSRMIEELARVLSRRETLRRIKQILSRKLKIIPMDLIDYIFKFLN